MGTCDDIRTRHLQSAPDRNPYGLGLYQGACTMNNILRVGGLIWTACGAAWLVLGYITQIETAYIVGVGCLAAAALFYNMGGDYNDCA
jgi:hypothetical protein